MSLKSIGLAAGMAAAILLVGCRDDDHAPINHRPRATPPAAPLSTGQDTPVTVSLSATDYDADPLTFVFDAASNRGGTVAGDPFSGIVTYTPGPSFTGVDSFTFHVSDGRIESDVVTVYVGVDNTAPTADDQPQPGGPTTDEDVPVLIALTADDLDGDDVVFAVDTTGLAGILDTTAMNSPAAPGLVTFFPSPDYFGTTSFTFTASDHVATSVPATVSIDVTPVSEAPVTVELTDVELFPDIDQLPDGRYVTNHPFAIQVTVGGLPVMPGAYRLTLWGADSYALDDNYGLGPLSFQDVSFTSDGEYNIVVSASEDGTAYCKARITVVWDTTPPVITITLP